MVRNGSSYRANRRNLARELATQLLKEPPSPSRFSHIGRWIAAGGTALAVCLIVASLAAAGVIDMTLAYICLSLAWVVAITASACSESVRGFSTRKITGAILVVALSVGALLFLIGWYETKYRAELTSITPDDLPTPATPCPVPLGATTVLMGSNVAFATKFPHTVIAAGRDEGGKLFPLLSLNKIKTEMW